MYKHFFKRVIDFTIALLALLIIWPILLVIYIWLTIANKGADALFYQEVLEVAHINKINKSSLIDCP